MVDSPNQSEWTDERLAEHVAGRDESDRAWRSAQDACELLYRRHARLLSAFLAARVRRDELDDVHQAVWERVWQHLPQRFRGGDFRAWLYRIARNYLIDQGRKRQATPLEDDKDFPDPRPGRPDETLLERERMDLLSRCLGKLDARSAAVVRARLGGESYDTLCPRLGLRPESAHKMFHQAKAQLQACVQQAAT
jgi:RNA polymerase sigma-70 factor (ECF subfamily)